MENNKNKIYLRLFNENEEICGVCIDKEHFLRDVHSKKEILDKMLERLENYLNGK